MNELQNTGNLNATLTASSFNQYNRLVDEFLHRIFRLVGEEAPEGLHDMYFNEEGVMTMLDGILDDLHVADPRIPPPADFEPYYRELIKSIHAVKVEDHVAHRLLQQLCEENVDQPGRAPSPPLDISSDDEPLVSSNNVTDKESDDLEYTDSEGDVTFVEPSGPPAERLFDDEAEEMPPGYESNEGGREDDSARGSEMEEVSNLESTPPPATPPAHVPLPPSLVDYPDDDDDL